jgi:hypothetical protein
MQDSNCSRLFMTVSSHSMILGHAAPFDRTAIFHVISKAITIFLRGGCFALPPDLEPLLYLPGGIPFLDGTIDVVLDSADADCDFKVYAAVSRPLAPFRVSEEIWDVCGAFSSSGAAL